MALLGGASRIGALSLALCLFGCAESSGVDSDPVDSGQTATRDVSNDEDAYDAALSDHIESDVVEDTSAGGEEDSSEREDAVDVADTEDDPRASDVASTDTAEEDADIGEPDVPDAATDVPLDCGDLARCGNECVDLLNDPTSCGFCGRTCVIDNADAACVGGECAIGACEPGYFDVDETLSNGCEIFDSCAPDEPCFTECGGESVTMCEDGIASCAIPAESCNLIDDDCNGACDDGAVEGCRNGIHRSSGNGHIFTDQLATATAAPYRLESENYFYLYTAAGASLRPLFLCRKPNGKYLLSTQTACEIGVAPSRTVGYISAEQQCGSVPLYRLHQGASDNHFYTLSAGERDNARDNLGYVEEGVAGYVWRAP